MLIESIPIHTISGLFLSVTTSHLLCKQKRQKHVLFLFPMMINMFLLFWYLQYISILNIKQSLEGPFAERRSGRGGKGTTGSLGLSRFRSSHQNLGTNGRGQVSQRLPGSCPSGSALDSKQTRRIRNRWYVSNMLMCLRSLQHSSFIPHYASLLPAAETPIIDHAIKVHCDVMKVGGEFLPRPNALMFNKEQKELTRKVSEIIRRMKADKWIDKLKVEWWINKIPARKCHEHRRLYNGLTMKNIGGIFIVMAAGCMTTIIFLRAENWYYERKVVSDARKARLQAIQGPVKATTSNGSIGPRKKTSKCSIQ